MTFPAVVRVFFAIDLPPSVKDQLAGVIGTLKKKSKPIPIRWTRPENLHITLQFLPEVKSEHLPALISHVRQKLEGTVHSYPIKLGKLHLFPNPYRPRVIVLDVEQQKELSVLSRLVGEGIVSANYAIEERPFRAHLTLGRIKQPQGADFSFLSEFKNVGVSEVELNEVVLFRSEPQENGSKYTPLERIVLSKNTIAG